MGCRDRRVAGARSLTTLAVVLALGCAGEGAQSGASQGTAADVGAARARVERYEAVPRFAAPGPPFDAVAAARGKTVFEIPITSEVPFITAVESGMKEAAEAVGARLVVYPNQGDPSQWAQGIHAAIARGADVITLFAQNPALLGPQIQQAEDAGIPVVVVRTSGEEEPCQKDPAGDVYGTACVPGPFEEAGRLEADWVIADSGGRASILVVTASDAPSTGPLLKGLKAELGRCPDCHATYVDVPIPEWANRMRGEVQSALVRDPTLDYVIPIYDSMSQYAVPATLAADAGERVKIATFNGTPFVLQMLQDADLIAMDVGENLAWLGWATMDQALRLLAGLEPARSERTPLRVFTDANVGETGHPPQLGEGYGDAYISGYARLWGLR
jgi:ribose transport system substrate-binding protein